MSKNKLTLPITFEVKKEYESADTRTFFPCLNSLLFNIWVLSNSFKALLLALISTGNVTI